MSRCLNKTMLIGNVGQSPEIRMTPSGTKVAKFSLATSRSYKEQEKTEWHRLTVFGKLADVVEQWVNKGDRLYVEGRIEYSTTEHKGTTRYWTDIIVQDLVMLGGQKRTDRPVSSTPSSDPDADLQF